MADHAGPEGAKQFGPHTAASAGVPIPTFNRLFVFEPPSGDDLAAAVAWMDERDVPFWVTVTAPVVEAVRDLAGDLGLASTGESQPGMALTPLDGVLPRESVVDISEATDPDELDDCVSVAATVFGIPPAIAQELHPASLLADDEVRPFVGRVDGQPVACGLLVRTGDVAGVYNIGVLDDFRRRGIGEAMTWEVLRAGREADCRVGVLQSSEMARSLYERMGFETVVTYRHFEPES